MTFMGSADVESSNCLNFDNKLLFVAYDAVFNIGRLSGVYQLTT